MSIVRFERILSAPEEEIDTALKTAFEEVPRISPLDKRLQVARVVAINGNLFPGDMKYLYDNSLNSYFRSDLMHPYDSFLRWKKVASDRTIHLYIDPSVSGYINSVAERLIDGGILIYIGPPRQHGRSDEIFYLTEGISEIQMAIEKYGDYCMIIAIDNEMTAGYNIAKIKTPEFFTITSYDPEWLVTYLLKDNKPSNRTYMVSGFAGMIGSQLHMQLRGWRLVYYPKGYVDYLSHNDVGQGRLKELDYLAAGLKNVIDTDTVNIVSDKSVLYDTLTKIDPEQKVVLPSKDLEETDTMESLGMGDTVIIRPVGHGAYKGAGIQVATTTEQLQKAYQEIHRTWPKATVSPYIRNPLLFNGRKMHLRVLLLVTSWGPIKMYGKADGSLAELPYTDSDYSNKKIHDTHMLGTDIYFVFPDMFQNYLVLDNMKSGLNEIHRLLEKALKGHVRSYRECRYGYELLGLDVMFRDTGEPILIEVNTNAGFNVIYEIGKETEYFKWYEDLTSWVFDNAISPFINSMSTVTIKPLGIASDTELKQLSVITTNPKIMSWIGVGEIWDFTDLKTKSVQSRLDFDKGEYLDWVIMDSDDVVGYISLRSLKVEVKGFSKDDMQIRVLVGDEGKGYATKAVMLSVSEYRRVFRTDNSILALIKSEKQLSTRGRGGKGRGGKTTRITNTASVKLFEKLGWKKSGFSSIRGDNYAVYALPK